MRPESLINHAASVYEIAVKSYKPTDKLVSEYFRSKKYLGSRDRKFISPVVFTAFRMKRLAEYCMNCNDRISGIISEKSIRTQALIISSLVLCSYFPEGKNPLNVKELVSFVPGCELLDPLAFLSAVSSIKLNISKEDAQIWLEGIKDKFIQLCKEFESNNLELISENLNLLATRANMPEEMVSILKSKYKPQEIIDIGDSLLHAAPLTVRVNKSKISVKEISEYFDSRNISNIVSSVTPASILFPDRVQLSEHKPFQAGLIEVQDEGSQIITFALSPDSGERILDACAGAGGKTMHIADLQGDTGKIVASDLEFKRLRELQKRAVKSGFNSIDIYCFQKDDKKGNRNLYNNLFDNEFDKVLVDVPCSGTGTSRRQPNQKWKINKRLISRLQENQLKILNFYSKYLRSGGTLIYSTCSFLPDENEKVVELFLKDNPEFEIYSLKNILDIQGVDTSAFDFYEDMLTILPENIKSDAFFVAALRRV